MVLIAIAYYSSVNDSRSLETTVTLIDLENHFYCSARESMILLLIDSGFLSGVENSNEI